MFTWPRIALATIVVLALAWVGWNLRAGALAEARADALEAQVRDYVDAAANRALVAKAEAERLAAEQTDRLTFGRLNDEALADPTAAAPALGVRSVNRLNAIR